MNEELKYKNWIYLIDQAIAKAVEENKEVIELNLTFDQAIFLRGCVHIAKREEVKE